MCIRDRANGGEQPGVFRQKAVSVTTENGDARAEKPENAIPPGAGANNRYKAESTNQRRALCDKVKVYSGVPPTVAVTRRYTAFCRLPFFF